MATRSRQASQLARALTERTGVDVRLGYHGTRRDAWGGWHVEWCDGPTTADMRAHVARLAARLPGIASADLRYTRGSSSVGEMVALLLWLDAAPHEIPFLSGWSLHEAHASAAYPEQADEAWQRRGRALQALAATSGTAAAIDTLSRRAGLDWRGALEWLDELAAGGRHLESVR
ncbi:MULTISPECIES: hypothetical protein [unclassified Nocardia]|uniref:hypothetical protein n=1 Tax=unclassified Nocardia TaxID=2637762 RepID=UPI00278BFAF9|nr:MULTISPECIES: hypothetical protein [unclassified Nocardia]